MLLKVLTHSGREYEVEVETYVAVSLNQQINDDSLITVVIGDRIISRIDIKYVGPAEQILEETETL